MRRDFALHLPVILLSEIGSVKMDNGMDMSLDDYDEATAMFYSIDCVTPKLFGKEHYHITEIISSGTEHIINAPIEVVRTTLDLWRDVSEIGGEVLLERLDDGKYVNKICYILDREDEQKKQ